MGAQRNDPDGGEAYVNRVMTLGLLVLAVATVVLAIDTSLSMEATDVAPSRIEAAQQAALSFIEELPPQINVGLVSFDGVARVRVTPTTADATVTPLEGTWTTDLEPSAVRAYIRRAGWGKAAERVLLGPEMAGPHDTEFRIDFVGDYFRMAQVSTDEQWQSGTFNLRDRTLTIDDEAPVGVNTFRVDLDGDTVVARVLRSGSPQRAEYAGVTLDSLYLVRTVAGLVANHVLLRSRVRGVVPRRWLICSVFHCWFHVPVSSPARRSG